MQSLPNYKLMNRQKSLKNSDCFITRTTHTFFFFYKVAVIRVVSNYNVLSTPHLCYLVRKIDTWIARIISDTWLYVEHNCYLIINL